MKQQTTKIVFKSIFFLLILSLFVSCNNKSAKLEGFDSESWKEDFNGCLNKRASLTPRLNELKDSLMGFTQENVIAVLGKPNQHKLHKRNQKFYVYFIEPSTECTNYKKSERVANITIRFGSLGKVREFVINQ